ncbi:SCO family protein [Bacillus sp. P14.5]|uniref:SCO family protein n=1 Tax=Bacillus sp. P14.5 TaxID=1983400 RepID=UPI000DEA7B87|nr:SCO family protein [Bacillus sp. P14.5]
MKKPAPTVLACLFVFLFGIGIFYIGTDGFKAYTAETARVNRLVDHQPAFPAVLLEDSSGRKYSIDEFKDKYVFITFFYTACTTVCPQLEYNMSQVYERLPAKDLGEEIVFLSISFDSERDHPDTLDRYKDYFYSDGETWRMARVPDQKELTWLLEYFGVIVIPDGDGNFAHNSAFYLVDKKGKLINIMDYTKVEEAATELKAVLK